MKRSPLCTLTAVQEALADAVVVQKPVEGHLHTLAKAYEVVHPAADPMVHQSLEAGIEQPSNSSWASQSLW